MTCLQGPRFFKNKKTKQYKKLNVFGVKTSLGRRLKMA